MKANFKLFYLLILGLGLFFTSCQDEVVEVTPPAEQEVITPESPIAVSLSAMTVNNGANDDILDNSSCFSVELPVTIIAGNITIVIEDEEDLIGLAEFLADFDDDDVFDFVFPITLIFGDYTEIVIENEQQLEELVSQCVDNDVDDVIECIDFVYPISFSVFNQDFDLIDTIVVENDEALYGFLDSLYDDDNALIVSLNYPVTLVYPNGETVQVNSNEELAEVIEAAEESCYDDEPYVCTEDELTANLTECLWEIDDEFDDFDDFYIGFNADGSLEILAGPNSQGADGNWELSTTDNGLVLTLSNITEFEEFFNGEWTIVECEGDEFEIVRGDVVLELEQECDNNSDDCDPYILGELLPFCQWDIELFTANSEFEEFTLDFSEDGTFIIEQDGELVTDDGTWNVGVTGTGGVLTMEVPGVDLGGDWVLIECDYEDSFEFTFQNGDDIMVLEKDCDDPNDGLFDCFLDFEPYIEVCDDGTDGPYEVDLTSVFANCPADSITYFETFEDAQNFVNPIANPSNYNVVNTQEVIYAKIEIDNESIILEIFIYIDDCGSNDDCSEGAVYDYLQTCEWVPVSFNGDDNLADYVMVFGSQALTIEGNGQVVTTTYSVQGNDPTFIFIDGINLPNIQALSGDWTVAFCDPEELVLIKNNDVLILEQDCN